MVSFVDVSILYITYNNMQYHAYIYSLDGAFL